MSDNLMLRAAYRNGCRAGLLFMRDNRPVINPYTDGTDDYLAWAVGYSHGVQDYCNAFN